VKAKRGKRVKSMNTSKTGQRVLTEASKPAQKITHTLLTDKALTPAQLKCLRNIAETVLPSNVDLTELLMNFKSGYSKGRAVEWLIQSCEKQPLMTRVNLLSIYLTLDTLWRNGEFV